MKKKTIALLATILFTTLCWSATEKEKAIARLHGRASCRRREWE
jgi:hypothetical protein